MPTFATQEEAVAWAHAQGDSPRIHVWAPREGGGDYGPDEVACDLSGEYEPGVLVVFHPSVVPLAGGGRTCTRCGLLDAPDNGQRH